MKFLRSGETYRNLKRSKSIYSVFNYIGELNKLITSIQGRLGHGGPSQNFLTTARAFLLEIINW